MVILRSSSSGRQSTLLVPLATRPCLSTALAMNNAASISEVLPLDAWPTTATVRIFEVSTGIGGSPALLAVYRGEYSQKAKVNQVKSPWRAGAFDIDG